MSSSIYQGLQSCLVEPRVLRLKLSPSKSYSSPSPAEEQDSDHSVTHSDPQIQTHLKMEQNQQNHTARGNGVGGWSFLQAPSGVDGHPPENRYAPTMALSPKSLEMCTESLGSETGSDGGSETGSDEKMSLFSPDETETSPSLASGRKSVRLSRLAKKLAKPR